MTPEQLKHKREAWGLKQEELAAAIHKTRLTVNRWENGNKIPPGAQKLLEMFFNDTSNNPKKIKNDTQVSIKKHLWHGGDTPNGFQTKAGSRYEELANGKYKVTVPFVPVKAQARYVAEYTDAEFISDLEDMTFIVDRVGNGKYLAFEIQNDSMDDNTKNSIPDGAVVLARELGRQHWTSKFRTNQYPFWIIVHKTTILCKEIVNHDVEKGIITCHSLNESPEYQDFDLKLDDVHQLFNIVKKTF